jgi:probable HAF family extracellular repeat protein
MKATTLNFIAATIIFALFAGSRLAGQGHENAKPIHYSVQNLGTLGGVLGSSAHSINDLGWVAGDGNLTGDSEEHAALWREGVVTDLGTLGGDNSNVDFPVKNDDGLIVGIAQISEADPLGETFCTWTCTPSGGACNGSSQSCRGFRWRDGLMEPLGTLGGNNSGAVGANNNALVVGVAENNTQDPNCVSPQVLDYEAVVWQGDAIHELPPVSGDVIGAAIAVNDYEQVAGGTGMCGQGPAIDPVFVHAVLWKNDSPTDLGKLGGAFNNVAWAMNNRGQVVGQSDLPGDNTGHAFLWQNGVMTDLGTLSGDFSSAAFGINEQEQVVGQSCDADGNCRAFLWQDGVMTDLNVLAAGSPLYLIAANDINSRGEIVGNGVDESSGVPLAFSAVPCDEENTSTQCFQTVAQHASSVTELANERPKIILPENIREVLRQSVKPFRLGRWPTHTGPRTASVTITDNASGSPQAIALSGTGVVSGSNATLAPTSLTFATQPLGTTSSAETVTLSNSGTATFNITSISFTGADPGDFAQTNTCGSSVAAGASCTISVTFTPEAINTRTASLSVSDDAPGSPQTVSLSGTGTEVKLVPSSLLFICEQRHNCPPPAGTVTLTNVGSTTLGITTVRITGSFYQTNTCENSSLGSGDSCTITVTFTGSECFLSKGAVSISDNGGASPQQVILSGVVECLL